MERYCLKSPDAWFSVLFIDLFAFPVAKISHRHFNFLLPDHFTFFSFFTFIIALFSLYSDHEIVFFILSLCASMFDCVDGKLARLKKLKTPHGKFIDALVDFIAHSIGFLFISYWFYLNSNYISSLVVCFWALYLGYMHINSVIKTPDTFVGDAKKSKIESSLLDRWEKFCSSRRLLSLPVTEVEISFLIIPISVCFMNYSSCILLLATFLYMAIRLISGKTKNKAFI